MNRLLSKHGEGRSSLSTLVTILVTRPRHIFSISSRLAWFSSARCSGCFLSIPGGECGKGVPWASGLANPMPS
eukprot:912749-Amorphochlora_amoeboformis.AAC.1